MKSSESKKSQNQISGKLTAAEEMKEGKVDFSVFKEYFFTFGWRSIGIILVINVLRYSLWLGENLWLADWSDDSGKIYIETNATTVPNTNGDVISVKMRLWVYAVLGVSQAVFVISNTLVAARGGIRAGKKLHDDLISSLVKFPISFFDKTPTGRVLNRCGKDIETVDAQLIRSLEMWTYCGFRVIFGCISICIGSPWYLIALPPFFYIYWNIQRIFVNTTRQLKRIESISKLVCPML